MVTKMVTNVTIWPARGAGGDQGVMQADREREVAEPETAICRPTASAKWLSPRGRSLLSAGGRRAHRALRVAGELVAEAVAAVLP